MISVLSAALAGRLHLRVASLVGLQLDAALVEAACAQRVRHYDLIRRLALNSHFNHFDECLVDLHAITRRRLKVLHIIILLAPFLSLLCSHFPLWLLVDLVADQHEREVLGIVWACILNEPILPLIECVEARWIRQVVAESAAVGAPVEGES